MNLPVTAQLAADVLPPGALDLLNRLQDIQRPDPPGYWPPAPGWWLLAGIVLTLTIVLIAWVRYRHAQRQPVRQALRELRDWQADARTQPDSAAAADLSALLKRVALCHYPHNEVAALSGDAWLRFLDRSGATDEFSTGPGRALGNDRFQPDFTLDPAALAAPCARWIRHQRRRNQRSRR